MICKQSTCCPLPIPHPSSPPRLLLILHSLRLPSLASLGITPSIDPRLKFCLVHRSQTITSASLFLDRLLHLVLHDPDVAFYPLDGGLQGLHSRKKHASVSTLVIPINCRIRRPLSSTRSPHCQNSRGIQTPAQRLHSSKSTIEYVYSHWKGEE